MTDRITHYDIHLVVEPALGKIRSIAAMQYTVPEKTKSIQFLLHRNLAMGQLIGTEISSFAVEPKTMFPFAPEAATVTANLKNWADAGREISFTMSYAGNLARIPASWGVNCVTAEWVELGMYGPWFPWHPATQPIFNYSVDIEIPQEFSAAGLGQAEKTSQGWRLSSSDPQSDIVVIAAPNLRTVTCSDGGVTTRVYFRGQDMATQDEKTALNLSEDALWVLKYFRNWLRDDSEKTSSAAIIMSPRLTGGGYTRPRLIVLSNAGEFFARPRSVFGFLAHELSHLWWTGAPTETWEDWLNEGLAEYSRLRAVEAKLGQNSLEQAVSKKREEVQGSPPIRGIARTSDDAYRVLYDKAALLLLDLAGRVGQNTFDAVLREFARLDYRDTEKFLKILAKHAGEPASREFDDLLSH